MAGVRLTLDLPGLLTLSTMRGAGALHSDGQWGEAALIGSPRIGCRLKMLPAPLVMPAQVGMPSARDGWNALAAHAHQEHGLCLLL